MCVSDPREDTAGSVDWWSMSRLSTGVRRCDTDPANLSASADQTLRPQTVTPPGYNRAVITSDMPDAAVAADRFLRSAAGRAAVHRTLTAKRLPATLADDLTQDVLRRVWVETAVNGTVVDNLEGFVVLLLHRAAVDIVRGRVRSPQTIDLRAVVDPDAEGQGVLASPLDVEADAIAGESLAVVRRVLHHGLTVDPAAGAAALSYLTVTVDAAPPAPDCPQPAGGATPADAAEWAALWYAGHRDCFARPGATHTAVVRQRRSRLARQFRKRLTDAAVAAGLDTEDDTEDDTEGAPDG
jgi:DNA-directed RNA polymerase specialized sigma24 family protein